MTDRELDRRCAEILGWTKVKKCWDDPEVWDGIPPSYPTNDFGLPLYSVIRNYSTSLDASRELLEWAFQREEGLDEFLSELMKKFPSTPEFIRNWMRAALLATPRQIAESFVEWFGGEK